MFKNYNSSISFIESFIHCNNIALEKKLSYGIFQIANFEDLLLNFENDVLKNYINKLFDFIKFTFDSDFSIELNNFNQIALCGIVSNTETFRVRIENFFINFKSYCDEKNFPLYFSLDFAAVLFNTKDRVHSLSSNILNVIQKVDVLLKDEIQSKIRFNIAIYDSSDNIFLKYKNNNDLASYFRKALNENRLALAYQPILDVQTGTIAKYEALLRVVTEDGDYLSALPFIKVAEKLGFIDQIDNFVIEKVVQDLKQTPNLILAMNLSNLTVYNKHLLKNAQKTLLDKSIASRLVLEITETGNLKDFELLADFTKYMQSFGCKIAIDDFGAGNTSLSQLRKIKADVIKIDGQFIHNIASRDENRYFVSAILKLISEIGAESVAEFVESEQTAQIVKNLGADYLQGNFISQALNYKPWLEKQKAIA